MVDKVIIWAPILAGAIFAIAIMAVLAMCIICCRWKKNGKNIANGEQLGTADGEKLGITDAYSGDGGKKSSDKSEHSEGGGYISVDKLALLTLQSMTLNARLDFLNEVLASYEEELKESYAEKAGTDRLLREEKPTPKITHAMNTARNNAKKAGKVGKDEVAFDYATVLKALSTTREFVVILADVYVEYVEHKVAEKVEKLNNVIKEENGQSKVASYILAKVQGPLGAFNRQIEGYRACRDRKESDTSTLESLEATLDKSFATTFELVKNIIDIDSSIDDIGTYWNASAYEGKRKHSKDADLEGSYSRFAEGPLGRSSIV